MAATTLSGFEQSLLPSAVPYMTRAAAGQLAGASGYCRELIALGFTFAAAQQATLQHARHLQDLARWGRDAEFAGLTGP
jgi:hypothetical protein